MIEVRGSSNVLLECVFQEEDALLAGSNANIEVSVNYRSSRDSTGEFGRTISGDIRAGVEEINIAPGWSEPNFDAPDPSDYLSILESMDGDGTQTNPYIITNDWELQAMQGNLSAYYVLGQNINASGTQNWNSGEGFAPVGDSTNEFEGNFNGNGLTIKNMFINLPSEDEIGLFGHINGAFLNNVILEDIDVQGNQYVAGLVGVAPSGATINNIHVSGTISGESYVAALSGYTWSTDIDGSSSYVTIEVQNGNSGGLVAAFESATLTNSHSIASITSQNVGSVGGLLGWTGNSVIIGSWSSGTVIDGGWATGGLIGYGWNFDVHNSYSTSSVSGDESVGGLIGFTDINSLINNSWSSGLVNGNSDVGGFTSYLDGDSISNYWNTETSDQTDAVGGGSDAGITGLTTSQMKQQSSFTDWDFSNIWSIDEGNSYPYLQNNVPDELPGIND